MTDTLEHRGPDDSGYWIDAPAAIALGHRRLAIVELSALGRQPMLSSSGRNVLVYNGEVYNYREIRAELERDGIRFRGNSDTEVILEACERWGVEPAVRRFAGMFAFAIWDRERHCLDLVRDRLGIKPLYWSHRGREVVFGSQLQALTSHSEFCAEIDRSALCAYMRYNYVPAPLSIYRDVSKVRPGTIVRFRVGRDPEEIEYWSMENVVRAGFLGRQASHSDCEVEESLDELLRHVVGGHMIADVPLGAFLSGGVDSTTVVALMQVQSTQPVKTFTIGFNDADYDEAPAAAAIARHLGTDHTELYVKPSDGLNVIPRLPAMFDEPLADVSQIPTYLVAALARRHVTVSLSGDGGDELFAGYNRHIAAAALARWYYPAPRLVRAVASQLIALASARRPGAVAGILPSSFRPQRLTDKLEKLSRAMTATDSADMYRRVVSHWSDPESIVIGGTEPGGLISDERIADVLHDPVARMQYLDTVSYLPDDILTKVDRATMAVSLEARVPLLDHRVVEFAWGLPAKFSIRDGYSKWILRRVLGRYVPPSLVDRPKMGFAVPLDSWLRGPLREWAEDLLNESSIREAGYLRPAPIRRRWSEHLAGVRNWQDSLWSVLMFQAWLRETRI